MQRAFTVKWLSVAIALLMIVLIMIPGKASAQITYKNMTPAQLDSIAKVNATRLKAASTALARLLPPSLYPTYNVASPPYCASRDSVVFTEAQYAPLAKMRRDTVYYVAPRSRLAVGERMQLQMLCFPKTKSTALIAVKASP